MRNSNSISKVMESVSYLYNDSGTQEFCRLLNGLHAGLFMNEIKDLDTATKRTVFEVAKPLDIAQGNLILDVGCGAAYPALLLAQKHNCHFEGITISNTEINEGEHLAKTFNLQNQINIRRMDAHKLTYRSDIFDGAIAIESFLYLDTPVALKEVFRVLKPGSSFSLADFYIKISLTKNEIAVLEQRCLFSLHTFSEYISLFEQAGFENIHVNDWTEFYLPTFDYFKAILAPEIESLEKWQIIKSYMEIMKEKLGYLNIYASKPLR